MRNSEFYYAFKFCEARNIRIYPIPVNNSGSMKICINRSGRESIGHEIYKNSVSHRLIDVQNNGVVKKVKITIPPIHVKIEELLIDIYRKNGGINQPGHLFNNSQLIQSFYNQKELPISVETIKEGLFFIYETSVEAFNFSKSFSPEVKKLTLEIYEKINEKTHCEAPKIAS